MDKIGAGAIMLDAFGPGVFMQLLFGSGEMRLEQLAKGMAEAVETLKPKEKTVLELGYGLASGEAMDPDEVARRMNVTTATVYNHRKRALRKLRHPTRFRIIRRAMEESR